MNAGTHPKGLHGDNSSWNRSDGRRPGTGWNTDATSSKNYNNTADKNNILGGHDGGAHGLFSSNAIVNPDFYNWNKVYARYCDGASFAGDVAEPVHVPATPVNTQCSLMIQNSRAACTEGVSFGCYPENSTMWAAKGCRGTMN